MNRIAFFVAWVWIAPLGLALSCDSGSGPAAAPATEGPGGENAPAESAKAAPYRTQIVLKGREVHLTGSAPDEIDRDSVRASLKARVGRKGKIRNDLSFRKGAPKGWSPALQVVGTQLVHFKAAKVVLVDQELSVSGVAVSAQGRDEAMDTIRRTIPADFTVTFDVSVDEAAAEG